jgi:hypothetical protein
MIEKGRFRMRSATLGIISRDGERTVVGIPANSIIEVISSTPGDRLSDVRWDGKSVAMFTEDLREHAQPIATRTPLHSATVVEENLRALLQEKAGASREPIPIKRMQRIRRDK